jgi:hypothetical protein
MESVSNVVSAVPDELYLRTKELVTGIPREPNRQQPGFYQQHGTFWGERVFCGMLKCAGYDIVETRALNFGRLRFMDRAVFPEHIDAKISAVVERVAQIRSLSALRDRATTHIALARPFWRAA